MVRPHHFRPNPLTAQDNGFQAPVPSLDDVAAAAHAEVTAAAAALERHGVRVHLFEDLAADRPDSVFCNNWFTTHHDGTVVVYPMHAANRRRERRQDVLDALCAHYGVTRVVDLAADVPPGRALEGTGAMVLDHVHRVAYVCRSRRTDERLLRRFCDEVGYRPFAFDAYDRGRPIYHTNVLMAVGATAAVVGADLLPDPDQRRALLRSLADGGREVVLLDRTEIRSFGGNCLELAGTEPLLALSATARRALRPRTLAHLEQHVQLLPLDIPVLELAGGSVRCMLAGIHLPRGGGTSSAGQVTP
ncbi:hypothetical protein CLV92_10760 [Kineococcus xinjiangensis]|uniref:Amidinotransferase n=2 Tax=Kineococcus xinjiangensis TaxID=512762 RepID=A0A2S6IK01_9ACTN|nr:hypothetical protein CLV92_10760 [Kineococcus xinjiangensis]